jgi:hypothetical protein
VNAAVEGLRHLGVDLGAKTGQAAKGCLNVTTWASKTIVNIQMPERGVDIVAPHQSDHAATKPDAFRVTGRTVDRLGRFHEFVGSALIVLGRFRALSRSASSRFTGLILGAGIAALGGGVSDAYQQDQTGDGEVTHDRTMKLQQPSTHKFPDWFWSHILTHWLMPFK